MSAGSGGSGLSGSAESGDSQRLAAAYLSRVAEPGSVPLWMLVAELGYPAAAAAVRSGDVDVEVASGTQARRESACPEADLEAAERNGIRLVTPADEDWPHFALAGLYASARRRCARWLAGERARPARGELLPPLALWVRGGGALDEVGVRSLAMVGSRAATAYGEHIASDFAYGLAREEVVVVSGGAYGIDAAAHRGALAADGVSVLVSAGGLDRPYPSGHASLYARVAERGVLVSEHPPGSAPHRQRFLSRNRLIASLGGATLVVEAGLRSGALNTAGHARDLGRSVLAVPGPITSAMSVGCHRLISRDEQPAQLVGSVSEVLAHCSPSSIEVGGAAGPAGSAAAKPTDCLDDASRAVLDGFPAAGEVGIVEIARLSGQPPAVVSECLPLLDRLGLVTVAEGGGYRLAELSVAR